ncbi:MAG: RNA polymerase factor sigma-54 [Ottowia sp.]|nr:RNA polymerase factor sigma-54 [Ottowia sp.]
MTGGTQLHTSLRVGLMPHLQQTIRLLQMTVQDLEVEVEHMLEDNPFLERTEAGFADSVPWVSDTPPATAPDSEIDPTFADTDLSVRNASDEASALSEFAVDGWEQDSGFNGGEWGDGPARGAEGADDEAGDMERSGPRETLAEHLHAQALALRIGGEEQAALRFLIESLNDDGYLEDSLAQLAATLLEDGDEDDEEQLQALIHRFTLALRLLQSLEPAGVGARSLAECLTLQIRARMASVDATKEECDALGAALAVCAQPQALDALAQRDIKKAAKLAHMDVRHVETAKECLARLDPHPGRAFGEVSQHFVVPEIIVSFKGEGAVKRLQVQLNHDVVPQLRVQELYARALRGGRGEDHQALSQRLQQARWFVKNIRQRFDTILRVARIIVERQRSFFLHGEQAMRPLRPREVAKVLGVHETTISRTVNGKYMATPRGTFELKYFFSQALSTETGGSASSTAVRALIRQFIAAEDSAKPLSDGRISEMLKEQGINCARRTVAKYREGMGIPVISQRAKGWKSSRF